MNDWPKDADKEKNAAKKWKDPSDGKFAVWLFSLHIQPEFGTHISRDAMRDEAKKYYFSCIKIYDVIEEARKACLVCNAVPDKKKMGKFSGHRETVIPRELLMGDCIDLGSMSAGELKYCFTVVDHSSKSAWVFLIKHKDAYTIHQCL